MTKLKPTIKGIFVKSHLRVVKELLGDQGVEELERRYGKKIEVSNSDTIPISEEVRIIEHAAELIARRSFSEQERAFEAGRLHFRNFATTPFGKIILSVFGKSFKLMMLQAKNIAGHVFQGVEFKSEEINPSTVKVTMENNDYPIEHFRGLFQEWMDFSGLAGTVEAKKTGPDKYEYTMNWNENA